MDVALIGEAIESRTVSWSARDVMLYALGVGAGQDDPRQELQFSTENVGGTLLQVLPTFGAVIGHAVLQAALNVGHVERVVHAEQALELCRPLPVSGTAEVIGEITAVDDKRSGTLVTVEGAARDTVDGQELLRVRASTFIRGTAGLRSVRGSALGSPDPGRPADYSLRARIPADQALIYRLSGDQNPLHVDPAVARRAGFAHPILHGLCTYGYAGRLLLHAVCQGDPRRLRGISARFSAPVVPPDTLTIHAWEQSEEEVLFKAVSATGEVVLDRGIVTRD